MINTFLVSMIISAITGLCIGAIVVAIINARDQQEEDDEIGGL